MQLEPIPIFIGIAERFNCIKGMTERSIRENTEALVDIVHLYPIKESGCTGFSDVRYHINYGIYLDCDMVVLGDIAKLWEYRKQGRYVCMKDGSTEVAVIDCEHSCTDKFQQDRLPKSCNIPGSWNVEDYKYFESGLLPDEINLFHFTAMAMQPWFYNHPLPKAVELYERYNNRQK